MEEVDDADYDDDLATALLFKNKKKCQKKKIKYINKKINCESEIKKSNMESKQKMWNSLQIENIVDGKN